MQSIHSELLDADFQPFYQGGGNFCDFLFCFPAHKDLS